MAEHESEAARSAMRELGMRHAMLEGQGDLEGTMDTVGDEPIYEFWPAGRRMAGRDAVRDYYRHLINEFMPRQTGYSMIAETLSADALSQEYMIELEGEEGPQRYRVLGILIVDPERPGRLQGERIWGDEAVLRLMVGPAWDGLDKIEG
jgi:hypothetical protein